MVMTIFRNQGFACIYIVVSLLNKKCQLPLYFHITVIF